MKVSSNHDEPYVTPSTGRFQVYDPALEQKLKTLDPVAMQAEMRETQLERERGESLRVGIPGYGESILLSATVEKAWLDQKPAIVTFFRQQDDSKSSMSAMVRNLIYQLLDLCDQSIYADLLAIYQGDGYPLPPFVPLWNCFAPMHREFKVYECS
ncbi:hypothetical protein BP5796_12602 [Coleophoma crateriformis]|uniref:Nephrocystin 3-like N-terminal domain-containing protein n=1 Tax=Coleophoma crateriformis TaxID=565419 RepID=A0A3D8Q7L8_9HELO|nr:hypothetical protein BP5796_12602 [Coleophoma crateriformis]